MFQSKAFRRFLEAWPGKRTFGVYRFLPFFFVLGAALEFSMINWHAGEVNFYKTYKRREAERTLDRSADWPLIGAGPSSVESDPAAAPPPTVR